MATDPEFQLGGDDRAELKRWLRRKTMRSGETLRARILLALDEGRTISDIASTLHVSRPTVYLWKRRYVDEGMQGLTDRPRSGRPSTIDPKSVERILFLTTQRIPKEATHWSTRLMTKYAGVSQWQVRKVWAAANLKPHRIKSFKISKDPQFAEKVIDVVGLYLDPPDNALVLSVDEKTQIQALDRTQPLLPMRPGQIERRTHDYRRHGTTNLYAAFDIATGKVLGRITQKHRAKEFLGFLRQIDRSTPTSLDLHLILDNSSTHKTDEVTDFLEAHPRFHFHFTPTSASWLNAVETWFSQLERRAIHRGAFTSVEELRRAIRQHIEAHNEHAAKPFRWTSSAEAILAAVERARQAHV
jgi:transposase